MTILSFNEDFPDVVYLETREGGRWVENDFDVDKFRKSFNEIADELAFTSDESFKVIRDRLNSSRRDSSDMTNPEKTWHKSSYTAPDNSCIELAVGEAETAVRNSKDPDDRSFVVSASAWIEFLAHAKTANSID